MRPPTVLLVLLLASPAALAGASRTESYVAAGGDILVDCALDIGLGGVCFDLDGSETTVRVAIADDGWPRVGGYWSFRDGPDSTLSSEIRGGHFCDEAAVVVPYGAVMMHVYIDQAQSTLDCAAGGFGTTGTVTADFS